MRARLQGLLQGLWALLQLPLATHSFPQHKGFQYLPAALKLKSKLPPFGPALPALITSLPSPLPSHSLCCSHKGLLIVPPTHQAPSCPRTFVDAVSPLMLFASPSLTGIFDPGCLEGPPEHQAQPTEHFLLLGLCHLPGRRFLGLVLPAGLPGPHPAVPYSPGAADVELEGDPSHLGLAQLRGSLSSHTLLLLLPAPLSLPPWGWCLSPAAASFLLSQMPTPTAQSPSSSSVG